MLDRPAPLRSLCGADFIGGFFEIKNNYYSMLLVSEPPGFTDGRE